MVHAVLAVLGLAVAVAGAYLLFLVYSDPIQGPVLPSHYNTERYAMGGRVGAGAEGPTWRYCTECETRNDADADRCRICGANLRVREDPDVEEVVQWIDD